MNRGMAFDRRVITASGRQLAFDRSTMRAYDADGRLHVKMSNISKATVNPYFGHEIPDYERLGLNPDRVYNLLRCPDELAKGAPSFNNLPILAEHVPVSAERHEPDLVIGSTGTDAEFVDPFLRNSAVIWAQAAIDDIEHEEKREWSCAYRYTADMTPGKFKGLRFDGIMRNIIGNHVALVTEGRAGSDVMVADSLPRGLKMIKSRSALMLQGAILAMAAPLIAKDAKIDLSLALDGVTAKNMKGRRDAIATMAVAAITPKLAKDEGLEVGDVVQIIDAVQGSTTDMVEDDDLNEPLDLTDEDDDKKTMDADGDCVARIMAFLEGKLSDEDMAAISAIAEGGGDPAMDSDDEDDDDKKKPAMDANAIADRARKSAVREFNAIREAERAVEPHVGTIKVAMDSAAAVYKLALDAAKVDLKGVPTAAYAAMVKMLPLPGDRPTTIALDHAPAKTDFDKRFPDANQLIRS
jgi:uncharacterized protein